MLNGDNVFPVIHDSAGTWSPEESITYYQVNVGDEEDTKLLLTESQLKRALSRASTKQGVLNDDDGNPWWKVWD